MKMKALHESISEEKILVTLIFEEQDNAGIVRQMIEIVENPRIPQERVSWPFARPHLGRTRKMILGLRSLLGVPSQRTP